MALRAEAVGDLLAVVALDLDGVALDGAARAAQPLQVAGRGLQDARLETADDGHDLAAATALLAEDAHDAVARGRGRRQAPLAGAAQVAALGGVDRSAVRHDTDGNARPVRTLALGPHAPRQRPHGAARLAAGPRRRRADRAADRGPRPRPLPAGVGGHRCATTWPGSGWTGTWSSSGSRSAAPSTTRRSTGWPPPAPSTSASARAPRCGRRRRRTAPSRSTPAPAATCPRPTAAPAARPAAARRCACASSTRCWRSTTSSTATSSRTSRRAATSSCGAPTGYTPTSWPSWSTTGRSPSRTCCAATTCCRRRRASCCCSACSACRRRSTPTCR